MLICRVVGIVNRMDKKSKAFEWEKIILLEHARGKQVIVVAFWNWHNKKGVQESSIYAFQSNIQKDKNAISLGGPGYQERVESLTKIMNER